MFKRLARLPLAPALWLCATALLAQAPSTPPRSFDAATGAITDARWKSGVPLGGIGVGKIELLTDGSFGNFTNQHNWDRPYGWAKGAFVAVRAQAGNGPAITRMLRRTGADEYQGVGNVAHTRMQGWFPKAQIDFGDEALPVRVRLDAFSPLVPHTPKDSALPIACLAYTLSNPTRQTVRASVLLAWPNLLGWGGRRDVSWDSLDGDRQTPAQSGSLSGLRYATTQTYPAADQRQDVTGEYFIGAHQDRSVVVTTCPSWDAADATPAFWSGWAGTGRLTALAGSPKQPAGAVAAETTLAPGQSRTVRFTIAWAMPHHVTVQKRTVYGPGVDRSTAGVAALFDNDPTTRWGTGRAQQAGDNLVLDLGAMQTVTHVALERGTAANDDPRGLRIDVSDDARTWRPAAQLTNEAVAGAVQNGVLDVPLSNAHGRYLRLTDLGSESFYWWSIFGLRVFVQGRDAPLPLTAQSATAYLIHADSKNIVEDVGHYWQNWWRGAPDMAAYADKNADRLRRETTAWQTPVRESSLPFWLQLKLINCAFPLYSNTILTRDGRFVVQESPVDMAGATGTMDQRMAAHAFYTAFFPELDRTELELFALCQQPDGRITHFDGNIHEVIGRPDVGYGITDWPDLSSAWVLQTAKLYRWTGDADFLARMQPHVTHAMDWLQADDKDGDNIPEGGSTYDYEHLPPGAFIYSASCYLGALRGAGALAAETGNAAGAQRYDQQLGRVQQSVMTNLWNGTFFRKWKSPVTGKTNENSFVANLAGDWLARLTGLPRTLPRNIVHQSVAQTIARHQKPYFPVPPMEVTPDGKLATSSCYLLQHEPYLGCEAIYENYVDDGLETLHRVYLCVWELNHSPWNESLAYDAPGGSQGGLITYMTCPTSWFVLNALTGTSLDLPRGTLYLSPRLTTGQRELHVPVYLSRFWGWLDYVPAAHKLTLRVDRVFPDDPAVEKTLYHLPGPSGTAPKDLTLRAVAADGDSPLLPLPRPFAVRAGSTLDLSSLIDRLVPPQQSETVNFQVKAKIERPGLPSDDWSLADSLHDSPELAAAFGHMALDGDPNTRWTTGRPMQPGDRLTLDMGKTQTVAKVVLDSAKSPNDYPHGYTLEASTDGLAWTPVARATQAQTEAAVQGGVLTITFAPVSARYLRLTNQGVAPGLFWSVHELTVYATP